MSLPDEVDFLRIQVTSNYPLYSYGHHHLELVPIFDNLTPLNPIPQPFASLLTCALVGKNSMKYFLNFKTP